MGDSIFDRQSETLRTEAAQVNSPSQRHGTGHDWRGSSIVSEVDKDHIIKRPSTTGLLVGGRHNVQVLKLTDSKDENPLETSTTGGRKSRKVSRKSKKKSHKKRPTCT